MRRASMKKVASHGLINDMLYIGMFIILIVIMSGISEHAAHAQDSADNALSKVSIKDGDEWRFFKGKTKSPYKWYNNGFDDSKWLKGSTGLGYGEGTNRTYLGDMQGNYLTVYARKEFTIKNIYLVTGMTLSVVCDGPFIAYLNDVEIIRSNSINKPTTGQSIAAPQAEELDVSGFIHELLPGNNVLSVECNNDDINSNDFSFIPFFEVFEDQGGAK